MYPLKKFLLWLLTLILICVIGISNVFAEEVDIGYITNKTTVSYENNNAQAMVSLPILTNVNSYLYSLLSINISNQNFLSNNIYLLELSTPNAKLQYINEVHIVDSSSNVCQFFGTSDFSIGYPKIYFKCNQATDNLTITLNNTNPSTLTSSITTSNNFQWNYSYLKYYTEDDDIDLGPIISNDNQNTQNIINNQNQNTQDIINSNKVCQNYNFNKQNNIDLENKSLNNDGTISDNSYTNISSYISINKNENYTMIFNPVSTVNYCLYNNNKSLLSCSSASSTGTTTITPTQDGYIRYTLPNSRNNRTFTFTGKYCQNGNQVVNDSINNLNDNINNDNTDGATGEASSFFSNFNTNTFGLTSIITAPLNLIQSITSTSCSTLHLPLPYLDNKYLDLPCMSTIYSQYFGSFFTLYQTITYGIIAYWVCVRIFNQVKDFKNPEHDEIEVLDL